MNSHVDRSSSPRRVILGEFLFDPETGDLSRLDSGDSLHRLSPQPAKLLSLLIERSTTLLERNEIRRALWPDVEVDFDQGLSFCIRQIRNALGDSAENPRYVETLPKRGYRLLIAPSEAPQVATAAADPEPDGVGASDPHTHNPANSGRSTGVRLGVLGLVGAVVAILLIGPRLGDRSPVPLRLAVMPFEAPANLDVPGHPQQISLHLVDTLATVDLDRLVVLGPTSTTAYATDMRSVKRLADELDADFVMNGRFFAAGVLEVESTESDDGKAEQAELLAELIRCSDGAHVWTRRYAADADWQAASGQIEAAIRKVLELPQER